MGEVKTQGVWEGLAKIIGMLPEQEGEVEVHAGGRGSGGCGHGHVCHLGGEWKV